MGAKDRNKIERNLNRAFSAAQIKKSANQVAKLGPRADFLDISEAVGALSDIQIGSLRRYRRVLTIPPLIRRILTATYREALFHQPKGLPLRIKINAARDHSIEVRSTDRSIVVVLTIGIGNR
jgi:hypothetical protein